MPPDGSAGSMPAPLTVALVGFGLGLSLAAPPGPVLALSAQRAVRWGFLPGLVVALGATTADATWAALMGFGVVPLLRDHPTLLALLALGGGLLMGCLAFLAWRAGRRSLDPAAVARDAADARRAGLAGGFAAGYLLAISSPFNLAWWLGAGTTLFERYGSLVFLFFFAALVLHSVLFVALVRWASGKVRWVVAAVSYASALLLGGFALYVTLDALGTLVA